jgi:DNA-binding transcriptional LysR family regulator
LTTNSGEFLTPIGNFSKRSVSASFSNPDPLYAYYPSRHHMPAKTRAFLDFVVELTSNNLRVGAS